MHLRAFEVTVALVIGVILATAALWWVSRDADVAAPPPTTTATAQTLGSQTGPADPEPLIEALIADRLVDHVLQGEITSERDGESSSMAVRRVRLGDRGVDQIGSSVAVFGDGRVQQCDVDIQGEARCLPAATARTPEQEAGAIRSLFNGPEPTYTVFDVVAPHCWLVVAQNLAATLPYGRTSEICFDETEQLIVRRDTNSRNGSERYVVSSFSFEVGENDLVLAEKVVDE